MRTPKEFDYDLWKENDGRYFVRVKRTKEVIAVDYRVFRTLHTSAVQMRRAKQGIPVYGKKNGKSVVVRRVPLTFIGFTAGEEQERKCHGVSQENVEDAIITQELVDEIRRNLSRKQLEVFDQCVLGGISPSVFATRLGVNQSYISRLMKEIRIISKNIIFFG